MVLGLRSTKTFQLLISLLILSSTHVYAAVNSTTVLDGLEFEGGEGNIRFHYDDSIDTENSCETVILLGVGTAMNVGDYDKLSSQVVADSSIVFIITDHSPGNPIKLGQKMRYAKLADLVAENLSTMIPVCKSQPRFGFIVGGHSASGQTAVNALGVITKFAPAGWLGLDPFRFPNDENVLASYKALPGTLNFGFSKTTCLVSIGQAGKRGYENSNSSSRVFFQVENTQGLLGPIAGAGICHCSFTDGGCLACAIEETQSQLVRVTVGKATKQLVASLASDRIRRSDFASISTDGLTFNLAVNEEAVPQEKESVAQLQPVLQTATAAA
jgi:hypothetical protein